jgi:hypothetical protein
MICGTPLQVSVRARVSACPSLASYSGTRIPKPLNDMLISQQTHYGVRPMR